MEKKIKPFFSVVIPLYNKENHIVSTVKTVLSQSFQNFEIVVVNDGSIDNSINLLLQLCDEKIRIINQNNAGVSAARNKGISESEGQYIALLDADDLWLENHLENLYGLIHNFPSAGIYATAYRVKDFNNEYKDINIYGLPKESVNLLIPNYFNSVANGDNLVWTSAVCMPKEIFESSNIWFPEGEKYGEDQYVWARVAIEYHIAYSVEPSAIYIHGAENNTIKSILNEKNPHKSFYMIKSLRSMIKDKEKLKGFDRYVSKIFYGFPLRNMRYRSKSYGLRQTLSMRLCFKHRVKLILLFILPRKLFPLLNKLRT